MLNVEGIDDRSDLGGALSGGRFCWLLLNTSPRVSTHVSGPIVLMSVLVAATLDLISVSVEHLWK